jgi:hypothetical protein
MFCGDLGTAAPVAPPLKFGPGSSTNSLNTRIFRRIIKQLHMKRPSMPENLLRVSFSEADSVTVEAALMHY